MSNMRSNNCYHNGKKLWRVTKMKAFIIMVKLMVLCGLIDAKVKLVDNGFEGIVVAINPYLKQEEAMLRRLEVR